MAPPTDDGPELLTMDEAARRLRMDTETLRRLIRRGLFPRPLLSSDGIRVWTDEDVRAHKYRIANGHRFRPSPKKPPAGPAGKKPRGQGRDSSGQGRASSTQPGGEPE